MPTSTTDAVLRARIDTFTTEITALVRASALEAVYSALGATLATAPAKRGPGRPAKFGTPSPVVAPSASRYSGPVSCGPLNSNVRWRP